MSDNLIERRRCGAKERGQLILVVRETPFPLASGKHAQVIAAWRDIMPSASAGFCINHGVLKIW